MRWTRKSTGGDRAVRWPKLALAVLFIGALAGFFAFGGPDYLTLDVIKQNRDALLSFAQTHYRAALLIAFVAYTGATALGIPSGVILSLLFGFLFGRWIATGIIVIGSTIGATLLFLGARYLFADAVRSRLGPFGKRISDGFSRDGFSWLLFLRLTPLVPYFLVNLAPAVTEIRARTFALATLIGIIPGTLVVTNLGQVLGRIESTRDLFSPQLLLAFAALGVLALVPVAIRHWRFKRR